MHKRLKIAAIAGILFLLISHWTFAFELQLTELHQRNEVVSRWINIFIDLALLSLFIIFIWGFKILGQRYQNNLLKTGSYVLIVAGILLFGIEEIIEDGLIPLFPIFGFIPTSIPIHFAHETVFIGADSIAMIIEALALILFGIGLLKLKRELGMITTFTGIIAIISGSIGLPITIPLVFGNSEFFVNPTNYLSNLLEGIVFFFLLPTGLLPLSPILWIIILFKAAKKLGATTTN
jgi:hypothetical protein